MEDRNKLIEKIDELDTPPQVKAILKSLTDPEVQQRVRSLHKLLSEIKENDKPTETELEEKRFELATKLAMKEEKYFILKKKLEKLKTECCDIHSELCDLDIEIAKYNARVSNKNNQI